MTGNRVAGHRFRSADSVRLRNALCVAPTSNLGALRLGSQPRRTNKKASRKDSPFCLWYLWEPARNYFREKFYRKNGQDSGNAEDKK